MYQSATGATMDNNTGLLRVSSVKNLQNLDFKIDGKTYPLTPNAQLFPRSLNSQIGGEEGANYLIVADVSYIRHRRLIDNFLRLSGNAARFQLRQGLDFINGFAFLERYYSVFNTANGQVGFATTPNTDATSN